MKPLVGFHLYAKAQLLAPHELVSIIKSFSKRKQEYHEDVLGEISLASRSEQNSSIPLVLGFILQYLTRQKNKLETFLIQLRQCAIYRFWPNRQYLIYEQLAL